MTLEEQKIHDDLLTHYMAVIRKLEYVVNIANAVRLGNVDMDYDTVEAAKISLDYHKEYLNSITN